MDKDYFVKEKMESQSCKNVGEATVDGDTGGNIERINEEMV